MLCVQTLTKKIPANVTRGEPTGGSPNIYNIIARIGGDEFIIVIRDVSNHEHIEAIAQKIINIASMPYVINDNEINSLISVGIASFPEDGDTIEILLKNADKAMYAAKNSRGNTCEYYNRIKK